MPLRLNVGVSKKVGLPGYGSAGASCNLEVELETGLLADPDALRERARSAYDTRRRAVHDELARLSPPPAGMTAPESDGRSRRDGPALADRPVDGLRDGAGRPRKPATPKQVAAIRTLANRQRADLDGLLRDDYGVGRPEDLSLSQASEFIDRLKAAAAVV
jgi:hypothetical protein